MLLLEATFLVVMRTHDGQVHRQIGHPLPLILALGIQLPRTFYQVLLPQIVFVFSPPPQGLLAAGRRVRSPLPAPRSEESEGRGR